jgi:putative ABC transport system permease protein
MRHTVFASLRSHWARLAMTALAVALGTGLMCGSFVFTATLTRSLDALFAQASTGTDVEVRHVSPAGALQGAGSASAQPVPTSLLAPIRALPDVAAADGTVSGRAVLLGRNGRPLPGKFAVALSWPAGTPFHAVFTGRQGQPPAGPRQVMIDRGSARAGHFTVGDHIEVAIGGRALPFTVSGITGYGGADSLAGGSMAIFSLPTAQTLFGLPGRYGTIDVKAIPGVSPERLRAEVARILPAGVQAVTAASAAVSEARQLNSQLGVLTTFFAAFAGVAMFVGAFVIWNTFSILISQRSRQLALLRALGAGRGQVFGSVLAEAAVMGATGAVAGAVLGIAVSRGLAALLSAFGLSLPATGLSVPLAQVVLGCALGLAVTLAAALAPAWRATRVAPVQALRDAAPGVRGFSGRRLAAALAVTGAGTALLLAGLLTGAAITVTAAGAGLCFLGVTIAGPLLAGPLAGAAGAPLTRLPAQVGALARGNTVRNPRRTSATAAALMVGLAVVTAVSVLVSSARSMISGQVAAAGKASFYVQATSTDTGLTPALAAVLARQPGVRAVTEVRTTDATVAGAAHRSVDGVVPGQIAAFTSLGRLQGSLSALSAGELLVSTAAARAHHWQVGDTVTIGFGSYGVSRLRIGGIFAQPGVLTDYLVSLATFTADTGRRVDTVDLVKAAASARGPLARALAGYPGAQLLDQAAYAKSRGAMLGSLLGLVTALLALAVIIALLGIANTLALSVVERTRELGLLRAIGMRRGQLAQMIAAESAIIAVIGAALGIALGLGLGTALAYAVTRGQQPTVTVPAGQLILFAAAAVLAGVAASVAPARRAAKLDMLAAIASE